jgi:aminoglycoside-2''-adenylyltransferase
VDDREAVFQALYGPWTPLTPGEVGDLFANAPFRWWIGGGWALELDGSARRRHEDIDIVVLLADVDAVRAQLAAFHLWEAHDGTLRPLLPGETLTPEREQLWVRRNAMEPWLADVVLAPSEGGRWLFKKDHRISLPLDDVGVTRDGVPFLKPEVALLHKAHSSRNKDESDFAAVLPALERPARAWLDGALAVYRPEHAWRERLAR